jgi:hypothetical protein
LTFKEVGRMTLRTFFKLYKCYKDNFDLELQLKLNKITYEEARQKSIQDEEWL